MPKYMVTFTKMVRKEATITVSADHPDDAKEEAYAFFEGNDTMWSEKTYDSDTYVTELR